MTGADGKLIVKEDRATLESAPSALAAVKQSAPVSSLAAKPDCFAAESENSRRSRNQAAPLADQEDDAGTIAPFSPSPPNLYNMGGLNPGSPIEPGFFENWCGLDWLTLTLWVNFGADWATEAAKDKKWIDVGGKAGKCAKDAAGRELRETLERYKVEAESKAEAVPMAEFGAALMQPGGGKIGGKYCRFKIELECAVILIADQCGYHGDWPNVKVEISGFDCLAFTGGAPEAYRAAMLWFGEHLGGEIHKERVSRCDICADFPEVGMGEFIARAEKRHWTCRSRVYHPYLCTGATSLYWGTGDLILRIYDKLGEMQASALRGAPAKYEHMIKKRWGGKEPSQAVRVEFQLRRDALKGFGITDFDSLSFGHGDLVRYLTGVGAVLRRWDDVNKCHKQQENARWFRFLTWEPDQKHPENNHTLPLWEFVQRVFCNRFLCPEVMEEIKPENSDIETLLKQAFGVLETCARERGYDLPGKKTAAPKKYHFDFYEDFQQWFCEQLRTVSIQKPGWEFRDKQQREQGEEDNGINE